VRVLLVNAFHYLRGGVERTYLDESRWLADAGHEVAHLAIRDPRNLPSPTSAHFAPAADYGRDAPLARQLAQLPRAVWSRPAAAAAAAVAREFRPEVVLNCAAFTRVDDCETRREIAFAANATGVGKALAAARQAGARLVQVSSDYVFDGRASAPYAEDAPTGPLSVYGESKLAGEGEALADPRSLVVRASWLFGPGGPNFVRTMLGLFERRRRDGTPVRVVDDQVGCPTYTPYLARALWDLAERGAAGRVHYRNREPVSWHGFAAEIALAAGFGPGFVEPIATTDFPRPDRRPAYSVLDVGRFEALCGRRVEAWSAGLEDYLERTRTRRN